MEIRGIKKATVLGAGVMGAQIAALLADAGVQVHLLDLTGDSEGGDEDQKKPDQRNAPVLRALEGLKKLKPNPWMSQASQSRIVPGNLSDDMSVVSESDWVIEAVVERLDVKKKIHRDIAAYVPPGVPVSTNTSGILLSEMADEFSADYAARFLGTHFFNPPRYMQLVEMIPHSQTDPEILQSLSQWIEQRLGKNIVVAADTVNFIANRIGVFALLAQMRHGERLGLNPETVDVLTGKLIGRPSSATYRTMDVVGLDTSFLVAGNVYQREPQDPYRDYFKPSEWIQKLLDLGHLGQKSGSKGVYWKTKDSEGRREIRCFRGQKESYEPLDVTAFPWQGKASGFKDLFQRISWIIAQDDSGAELVWKSWSDVFSYSALLVEQIAGGSPHKIDDAMRWGFQWQWGPFETWQGLGFHQITKRMMDEGARLPQWIKDAVEDPDFAFYRPMPWQEPWMCGEERMEYRVDEQSLSSLALKIHKIGLPTTAWTGDSRWVKGNGAASLLDGGDGVAILNFHTKMNAIDRDLLVMIQESVEHVGEHFKALVIANDGAAFSAGADLKMLLGLVEAQAYEEIDDVLRQFQGAMQALKFAPFPVVSAPHGMVLGGGCEVTLHTSHRHAAAESYVGLVEAGVGLIPAAGGTKELALRAYLLAEHYHQDPMLFLEKPFKTVAMAQVSSSVQEAVTLGLYPSEGTSFTLSRDHQTLEAKKIALLAVEQGYRPKQVSRNIAVAGSAGWETFKMMLYNMKKGAMISEHDSLVAEKLAYVLCGGDVDRGTRVDENWLLDLERAAFVELCSESRTKGRIAHMLKTGKALRN